MGGGGVGVLYTIYVHLDGSMNLIYCDYMCPVPLRGPRVIKNRWAIKKGWVQRSSGLPCLFMRLLIVCNQLLECRVPSTYICMCMYELPKGLG